MPETRNTKRHPWVAGLLSAMTIGLGHVYVGQGTKSIKFFVGLLAAYVVVMSGLYFGSAVGFACSTIAIVIAIGIWVFALIDAVKKAKAAHPYELKPYNRWYVYVGVLLLPSILSSGVKTVFVKAYTIPAGSMLPTLEIGDHILVDRLAYGVHLPFTDRYLTRFAAVQRGDLVVFMYPEDRTKEFVKRTIAVAGDTVELRKQELFINGKPVEEPYAYFIGYDQRGGAAGIGDDYGPRTVPERSVFVLGDNRDRSYDSRFWGFADLDDVRGQAFRIYWSWNRDAGRVRWGRVGKTIR